MAVPVRRDAPPATINNAEKAIPNSLRVACLAAVATCVVLGFVTAHYLPQASLAGRISLISADALMGTFTLFGLGATALAGRERRKKHKAYKQLYPTVEIKPKGWSKTAWKCIGVAALVMLAAGSIFALKHFSGTDALSTAEHTALCGGAAVGTGSLTGLGILGIAHKFSRRKRLDGG